MNIKDFQLHVRIAIRSSSIVSTLQVEPNTTGNIENAECRASKYSQYKLYAVNVAAAAVAAAQHNEAGIIAFYCLMTV